jgi:hypothetical protein
MGTVQAQANMSLDGYVAKQDNTIGRLFDWLPPPATSPGSRPGTRTDGAPGRWPTGASALLARPR